jgi:mTERF domain-containing protein
LLLCTSADSLHLRSFTALANASTAQPPSNRCTHTYSSLPFGQQSLGLSTRRGLCTARGTPTDEEEIQEYLELTDAEVARIVDKCGGSRDFVGNGVNHNFVEGRLKPLKEYLGLTIAELKKIVISYSSVLSYIHDNLVNEKLKPLQRYLDLTDGELKKIVVRNPQVLGYNHGSVVNEKLEPLKRYLDLTDAELKKIVIRLPAVLGLNHDNLANEKLEPLTRYLDLTDAELKKIVVRLPVVLGYNHDNLVNEKLEPLKRYLDLTDAELKKIVIRLPVVLGLNHDNLVNEKLEPLKRYLDLADGELKKIVVGLPAVLGYNHDSVVKKLKLQQECLGYTDEEMRAAVIAHTTTLGYGLIEEKWALMMSRFTEEEGDQKLAALRSRGPRGLGVGLARLQDRLGDLEALLGRAPKASEWFSRLVMYKPSKWEHALANHARE